MYLLGYDIGGTKIEAAVICLGKEAQGGGEVRFSLQTKQGEIIPGAIVSRRRAATERQYGYQQIIEKLAQLCQDACNGAQVKIQDLCGIGFGVPGSVHPQQQKMLNGNTMALIGKDIRSDLQKQLQLTIPMICENDANCFAIAEVKCGAGIEYFKKSNKPVQDHTAIGVILGTGCGGGIVVNGQLLQGRRGGAGEIGHTILYAQGHPCYCGRNGCAEQYLAGVALEAAFAQRHYAQIDGFPNACRIFELARLLDPAAVAVVKQYVRDLGKFLGNLVNIFDVDYFVLGGGMSLQDYIYEGISKHIADNLFIYDSEILVYRHRLGDSAGVIGAALCVAESVRNEFSNTF